MAKEVSRSALVTIVSVGTLALVPRIVWESGRIKTACILCLCAHSLAERFYTGVQRALCRILLWAGVGVPVPRFRDERLPDTPGPPPRAAAAPAVSRQTPRTNTQQEKRDSRPRRSPARRRPLGAKQE